jgi:GTP cyclohydrolase I
LEINPYIYGGKQAWLMHFSITPFFVAKGTAVTATLNDIIRVMEALAPSALAEPWDNSGLQVGRDDQPVKLIWIALDPSIEVVGAACRNQVDLLITHHPLFFKPIKSLDNSTPTGKIVRQAILHNLAVFSAHTNLDAVSEGINDALAARLGLENVRMLPCGDEPLMPGKNMGMGRVGDLEKPLKLADFVQRTKERLALDAVKAAGRKDLMVQQVAVCCGSGSSLMSLFFVSGAQAFVSGDLKYHDARDAEATGRGLIDIGHFASEHLFLDILEQKLIREFTARRMDVMVCGYKMEKDPFQTY